jgi:hypothetical protein
LPKDVQEEPNGKKKSPPKSQIFDEEGDEEPGSPSEAFPQTDTGTTTTTHSLEKILNTQPQAGEKKGKPVKVDDILLNEGIKYLKAIMIANERKTV